MSRFHSLPRPALLALRFLGALSFTATLLLVLLAALGIWPTGASAAPVAQGPAFDCATVSEIPQAECQALVSLYNNTDGPNWTNRTKWLEAPTPCSWFGVRCSATGTVIALELQSNNLSGPLPQELNQLTNLVTLDLSGNADLPSNRLVGPIPGLSNLTNLRRLNLRWNRLTGPIPGTLPGLPRLAELWLDHNALTGGIPISLTNMITLTQLSLGNNPSLGGPIPLELGKLTNLETLYLYNDGLTGTIPSSLKNLTKLKQIGIYMNRMDPAPFPVELTRLTNLTQLWLASSNLTGPIPDLKPLKELTNLHLGNNQLTGPVPNLSELKKLKWAALGINRLSGSIPASLATLSPTLETLYLSYNQLTGPVPQELCALTKTMTTTVYIDHNALDLAPAPLCPQVIDPSWTWTQTLPPTDIQATALSTSSISLSWSPIAYQADGGGYQVLLSTTRGDPGTYSRVVTDLVKSATGYTATNLAAGTTYHFAVRTRTPPMPVPGAGYQRNDLWSVYSRDVTTATLIPDGTLITLKEETAAGRPVSGAEVVAYRGAITVAQGTTNAHGQVVFDDLQAEDSILARSLQHEQPSAKAQHHSGAEPDWSYRVYLTDLDIRPNGYVSRTVVGQPGQQLTTTVKRDNALVLFNLVASTEWNASEDELNFLRDEMIKASDFLYDVTDGQFAFGHVDIYDDAQHLRDADLRILASNQVIPNAIVGGIAATDTFTYTSSAGRTTVYTPGFLRMQPAWDTDKEYPQCGGFCRTLVHEFAHYGLFLYDEYYKFEDGKAVEAHCTSPDPQDIAGGASIMDQPYKTNELAMRDTLQWSPEYCEKTEQWNIHEESDWETVTRVYTDTERSPAAPRWEFKTPRTLGRVANPGPVVIPISLTAIITHDVPFQSTPITASVEVSLSSANKQAQVFLFKGDPFTSITEVGSPITSTIKVWGLEVGDELKAVTTDGSEFASQDVTSTAKPLELRPTTWKPRIEALPELPEPPGAQDTGLVLTVTQAISVEGALQALLIEPGGVYSQTITMTKTGAGAYRGDLSFDFTHSAREGYLYVWGSSRAGERLETMTTYRIAGAPGSHEWAYPTTDLGSLDGLLRLNIPGHVPTTTLIIVMPVYQLEPLGSSAAAWAAGLRPTSEAKSARGTDPRTLVGPAHSIRASGGTKMLPEDSTLTLFYTEAMGEGLENAHLSIHFYNEETRQWEDMGGVVDRQNRSVSAPVKRYGIYALVKVFHSYLPIIIK